MPPLSLNVLVVVVVVGNWSCSPRALNAFRAGKDKSASVSASVSVSESVKWHYSIA